MLIQLKLNVWLWDRQYDKGLKGIFPFLVANIFPLMEHRTTKKTHKDSHCMSLRKQLIVKLAKFPQYKNIKKNGKICTLSEIMEIE